MTGVFSKICTWVANAVKIVGKMCNIGKRASAFIWWDGHNVKYVGSPELVLKIQGSMNCHICCENGNYIEAMKRDSLNLAKGHITVDVEYNLSNQEIIKKIADNQEVTPLPCQVDLISQPEAVAWLSVELKQDYIEQGLKPVSEIPWRKPAYTPTCWDHPVKSMWPWPTVSNPKKKAEFPPLGGLRKVDVYKQVIRNRLALKGINEADHISSEYTKGKERAKLIAHGIKVNPVAVAVAEVEVAATIRVDAEPEPEDELELHLEEDPNNAELSADINNSFEEDSCDEPVDDLGRRILPSREKPSTLNTEDTDDTEDGGDAGEAEDTDDAVMYRHEEDSSEQNSDMEVELEAEPVISRRGRGRGVRGGRVRGRGVGKGGRKLGVRGGLIDKNELAPAPRSIAIREARHQRKVDWQKWVKAYTNQTEKIISKSKRDWIKCTECKEKIDKGSFLKHRTRNCLQIDPKLKMANWDIANYF